MDAMTGAVRDRGPYTLADLDAFPDDGSRYEIADGWLIVSPMARRAHAFASTELGDVLKRACPPHLYVFGLPINVDDPAATHFEPDLAVVGREFVAIENGDLPVLVVEVRSPSTAGVDAGRKRAAYARLGVASYWLVDVDEPSIRVLELTSTGGYEETGYAQRHDVLHVERPFPVELTPAALTP